MAPETRAARGVDSASPSRGARPPAQLDQHAAQALRVQERNPGAVGARAGRIVDGLDSRGAAALEHALEIGHLEAHVMEPGATLLEEPGDGVIRGARLEQLEG